MPVPARNDAEVPITVGLDTHLDLHVTVALDHLGCRLDELTVPTTEAGYAKLLRWAEALGSLERVGSEGALGLSAPAWRYLWEKGMEVLEVGRPKCRDQHRSGKSDPIDAELAARAGLAGTAIGEGLGGDHRNDPGAAGRPPIRGEGTCPGGEAAHTRRFLLGSRSRSRRTT